MLLIYSVFDSVLNLLTEQVGFSLLIFLLLLPSPILFTFTHEENPIFYYYCPKYFNIF